MADDPTVAELQQTITKLREEKNEFRENNNRLKNENEELKARYKDIDPAVVAADRAKLAEFEKAKPHERVTTLETELAAEKTAHADTRKRADALVIESAVADVFSKAGGRPEARTFIAAQAAGQFVVENGHVKGTKFSPDRAGEPMSVSEWITLQTRQNAFCFLPSSGGGADPASSGRVTGSAKELRNPTPQDLGRYGKEIASGEMKVVYTE
jgi:regulator of replication initiation timing